MRRHPTETRLRDLPISWLAGRMPCRRRRARGGGGCRWAARDFRLVTTLHM